MVDQIPVLADVPSSYTVFPVVEFLSGKYATVSSPERVLVPTFEVDAKNPDGSMKAKRCQIPLMLAW